LFSSKKRISSFSVRHNSPIRGKSPLTLQC
jgi:hypothetical protein